MQPHLVLICLGKPTPDELNQVKQKRKEREDIL